MLSRSIAFLVWVVVAASAVFWASRLLARPSMVPPQTVVAAPSTALKADLVRLFGPDPVRQEAAPEDEEPDQSDRFQLLGVVAPKGGGRSQGVALIAVDGGTARAYRVGATVDGDQVLQKVEPRAAELGPRQGGSPIRLELPALPPPATGSLPTATAAGKPATPGSKPAKGLAAPTQPNPFPGQPLVRPGAPAPLMPTPVPFKAPGMPMPQPQAQPQSQPQQMPSPGGTEAADEGQPVTR